MDPELRDKYADYISTGLRYVVSETNIFIPENTIIIVQTYSVLNELDTILGLPIFVCDTTADREFWVAIPSNEKDAIRFCKAFTEFMELNPMS
jgi:hypothetical protein